VRRHFAVDDEPVRIVPYDASWPARFEAEKTLLDKSIGRWATGGIHHVGSTAVPGLAAKPVIDILVGVQDLDSSRDCFEALATLRYRYAAYRPDEMHWFCKPDPARRTHHLHLVPADSPRYRAELAFRDALRAQPDLAARYQRLKESLAREHRDDREAYIDGKRGFIAQALGWGETRTTTPVGGAALRRGADRLKPTPQTLERRQPTHPSPATPDVDAPLLSS
jgi:GrpB-like predicted nucleotidyltransferase (UPF0157 family)